jgi:hypothetical protein
LVGVGVPVGVGVLVGVGVPVGVGVLVGVGVPLAVGVLLGLALELGLLLVLGLVRVVPLALGWALAFFVWRLADFCRCRASWPTSCAAPAESRAGDCPPAASECAAAAGRTEHGAVTIGG